jgi:hypothetical protein
MMLFVAWCTKLQKVPMSQNTQIVSAIRMTIYKLVNPGAPFGAMGFPSAVYFAALD